MFLKKGIAFDNRRENRVRICRNYYIKKISLVFVYIYSYLHVLFNNILTTKVFRTHNNELQYFNNEEQYFNTKMLYSCLLHTRTYNIQSRNSSYSYSRTCVKLLAIRSVAKLNVFGTCKYFCFCPVHLMFLLWSVSL